MLNPAFEGGINMRDRKKAEEIATERLQLLSPLLAEGLDSARARQLRGADLHSGRYFRTDPAPLPGPLPGAGLRWPEAKKQRLL